MPSDDKYEAICAWYIRPLHRLWWRFALIGPLSLVLAALLMRSTAEDPVANLEESRKAVLALAPKRPPDEENAAPIYEKAFALYSRYKGNAKGKGANDPSANLEREGAYYEQADVVEYLNANEPALKWIEAAALKEKCVFPLKYEDGFTMELKHLGKMRQAARLLCLRARVLAHRGEHQASARDFERMNKLAAHTGVDPILISGLVDSAICGIETMGMQAIVSNDPPEAVPDIEAYRNAFENPPDPQYEYSRFMKGEKQLGEYALDRIATGELDAAGEHTAKPLAIPWFIMYGAGRKSYSNAMEKAISPQTRESFNHALESGTFPDGFNFYTRFVPALARNYAKLGRRNDSMTAADVGLACMNYRAQNGSLPSKVEELVPKFLPKIPLDVFQHQPLKFHVTREDLICQDRKPLTIPKGSLIIYDAGEDGGADPEKLYLLAHHGHPFESNNFAYGWFFIPPVTNERK